MEIKVLGTGCKKCKAFDQMVRKVIESNNIEANVQKEEDLLQIMAYGVMSTPALVINEKVVAKGRVPNEKEILELLKAE